MKEEIHAWNSKKMSSTLFEHNINVNPPNQIIYYMSVPKIPTMLPPLNIVYLLVIIGSYAVSPLFPHKITKHLFIILNYSNTYRIDIKDDRVDRTENHIIRGL